MVSPLTNKTYRRLFSAQLIALAGTGLTTVALALLAYDLAGGNAAQVLGFALAIKMIAYVSIAPVVGSIAHRLQRRWLLIALDLGRAAIVAFLPFVSEVWQIYVLIFFLSAGSAGFTPTFQATIPDILPDESQYTRALSLSRLAYDLENLLSPAAAAAALAVFSYDVLFASNAVAFLASAGLVLSVRLPSPTPIKRTTGTWYNTTYGIRLYMSTPRLRGLLSLSLAVAAGGAMVIINTVVYVRGILGGSESDTAVALAAYGAGSMLVALSLPKLLERQPDRPYMIAGSGLMAAGLMAGAFMPGFTALLVLWFVIGAGGSLVLTPAGRLLRRSCEAADRPAVFAAQFALSHACWLATYPLAGLVANHFGITAAFVLLASISIAATASALYYWRA